MESRVKPIHEGYSINVNLGKQLGEENEFLIPPEILFGRHAAVLGTTGGGKSWSLARIMEEVARMRSKVILLDAVGEFHKLMEGVYHVSIGSAPHPLGNAKEVAVPYHHLRESDMWAIFKPSGPSQGPKLRAAMKSLKLARLSPELAPEGNIIKVFKGKQRYEEEYLHFAAELENPYALFDIDKLPSQIQHECVDMQRSALEPLFWGGVNNVDLSYCVPLMNRVHDIIESPNLTCIFHPGNLPSIFTEMAEFLNSPHERIMCISLKYLPFEHNAREIVANALGRHLLELARQDYFRTFPLLVVVDEAHQFLQSTIRMEGEEFTLDSFALIAKEGRKFGLTTILSTQRPRDIPEGVLSQMGTFLVHRTINGRDLEVIEKACGELDPETARMIPLLESGQGLLIGVGIGKPRVIRITAPEQRPDSKGADYQQYWR